MHYIVYQITNLINGKIYIGVHKTLDINDEYMGSGKLIKRAIAKHGIENFKREILSFLDDKDAMYELEAKLVDEDFITRDDTYNLNVGGSGSWEYVHNLNLHRQVGKMIMRDKNGNTFKGSLKDERYISGEWESIKVGHMVVKDVEGNAFQIKINDPRYLSGELVGITKGFVIVKDNNNKKSLVKINDPRYLSGELVCIWKGRKHKEESKRKIGIANSKAQLGKKNSQYGTCWIYSTKLKENKKIRRNDLKLWILKGWLKGRKIKKDK